MIEIERGTGTERKVWKFTYRVNESHNLNFPAGLDLRLVYFGTETRTSTRHKWRGEFWDYNDERSYHSKLPRPTHIPEDVLEEVKCRVAAKLVAAPTIFLGWWSDRRIYKGREE